MTFGLQFTNGSGVVTLDSASARLVVIGTGRFVPNAEGGMTANVTFPRPVTTQSPPLIFVRPDTVNGVAGLCRLRVLGSAGNWTGFSVRAYNNQTAQPNGNYFVAAFAAQAVATFGLRLWGEGGGLIFDSETPCALFTRAFQGWSFVKSDQTATSSYRNYYKVNFNFPAGEYMLLNSFSQGMCSGSSTPRALATWWDFPGNTLWAITDAFANPTAFFLPALFAKLTA
jgi:hypothetical protein